MSVKVHFVDLKKQYLGIKEDIHQAINNVIVNSAYIKGRYVKKFENEFAYFCGAKYCIGVGNGTDALYITLRSLGIGPGDEVITVANTFIATSEAITMTGAKVVFVDCDPAYYNINVSNVLAAISPRTKAIVPVHLYGQPANMFELKKIAKEHNLLLVEDGAQAHGAEINGIRVGSLGDAACFSFYPGKNLGAFGDAGGIVTNDEGLATKCRMIADHGRIEKYDHKIEGMNSRLDGLQAAILSIKLKYLEAWTEKRRAHATFYRNLLKDSDIVTPCEVEGTRHVYHLFVVRVQNRDQVRTRLSEKGVATGIHYPIALPNLTAYRYLGYKPEDFPVATQYSKEILSLPIYPELREEQIEYICDQLKESVL
jgi:dTDP-4-amino-4,6-dideoxygalactose transaminase